MNDNDIFFDWLFLEQLGTQSKKCRVDVADFFIRKPCVDCAYKIQIYHKQLIMFFIISCFSRPDLVLPLT